VPNSSNYVKHEYTFKDLNLEDWAKSNSLNPKSTALSLNGVVLNASDYGAPQHRKRFICGEAIVDGKFPMPEPLGKPELVLRDLRSKMPKPNAKKPVGIWQDPNYPSLELKADQISDHFYDTGLYITEWEQARYLKTMHPFMGRMSFPEAEDRPSRTITATRSASTREALIYKSEYRRTGHGEYRAPTIREAATLMGYPYTYQFFGSESLKWKLIGNSVSPQLSAALAKAILLKEGRRPVPLESIDFSSKRNLHKLVNNLNTYSPAKFADKKVRKHGARFRRPIYKGQNITVDLLNHRPGKDDAVGKRWLVGVFYGTGSNHRHDYLDIATHRRLAEVLQIEYDLLEDFIAELEAITDDQLSPAILQDRYENDTELTDSRNPLVIAGRVQALCDKYADIRPNHRLPFDGLVRADFSLAQLLSMFSLTYIVYNKLQREQTVGGVSLTYEYEMA
jgi:DNA (cytosine-5)-methyltransferase 1